MTLLQLQFDPSVLLTAEGITSLLGLTLLEIVLGIDNIIVISILAGDLPVSKQAKARRIGLALAMITRVLLLLTISWMASMQTTLFSIGSLDLNGRDLVMLFGGLFLVYKAGKETWEKVELKDLHDAEHKHRSAMSSVIFQIVLIDIVFSLDSVITAVGLSNQILIMIIAVIVAVLIMLWASGPISTFVNRHATVKVLALAFLIIVGLVLMLEGIAPEIAHEYHIKNYVYAAMLFSVLVEMLNLRMRNNAERHVKGGAGPDRED